MSILNGIYDPLGLITPFTVKGKILMRKLWMLKLGWDDQIPSDVSSECLDFFEAMLEIPSIKFGRCIKPRGITGDPMLVLFSDASAEAFGACAYVVWETQDGKNTATLLASKGKIAPLKVISIVRLELSAAVLSKRLRSSIVKGCRYKFSKIVHVVDSEIVRAMISKESYGFKTFVATRVGEIRDETDPSEWHWVNTKLNIADGLTKGLSPKLLSQSSSWQRGPDFLQTPYECWPLKQESSIVELPEKVMTLTLNRIPMEECVIDISRFSNYMRLIRTTARILCLKIKSKNYSLKNIGIELKPDHVQSAVKFWVISCQDGMRGDLEDAVKGKNKLRTLNITKKNDGIYYACGRTQAWNEMSYNTDDLPILPKKHQFSMLFVEYMHRQGHLGVSAVVAKIRTFFWIVGVERLVKSVRYHCIKCKKCTKGSNHKLWLHSLWNR